MRLALITCLAFSMWACSTQSTTATLPPAPPETPITLVTSGIENRPKLVVGIAIDQMKMDYLYRYWNDFSDGGFKRLVNYGTLCSDNHYSFAPTFTGPGHTAIYSGTTPAVNGIIANDWYDREAGMVYCASDTSQRGVGTERNGGRMSPHRLLTNSIGDELGLSNQFESKVIGISMKDRGAILPAGHHPTGAYWFMGKDEGNFVTSTYYTDRLPSWVQEFNAKKLADDYLAQGWKKLKPDDAYNESYIDNNPYEAPFSGTARPAFPYDFSRVTDNRYNLIKATPHGASISVDFAIAAIEGESMGEDEFPDLLALSFSNTDYAGHQFGPQSIEVQDTYLRLDLEIKRLLEYLDSKIGDGEYTVFLTADHGGAPVPSYMESLNIPGGYWKPQTMLDAVDDALEAEFGPGEWVVNYSNDQFFFDPELMFNNGVSVEDLAEVTIATCVEFEEVAFALSREEFLEQDYDEIPLRAVQRGFHPQRSGDVIVVTLPGYIEYGFQGTTHGSPYNYDTHVPLIFYGKGVARGKEIRRRTHIRDIAPTVTNILRVTQPTGCTGSIIHEIFE